MMRPAPDPLRAGAALHAELRVRAKDADRATPMRA